MTRLETKQASKALLHDIAKSAYVSYVSDKIPMGSGMFCLAVAQSH